MQNNYQIGDTDTRPWGSYVVLDAGAGFIVKRITVNPGGILSLQRHKHRSEHWIIASGAGVVTLGDKKIAVRTNDHIFIEIGAWHRIQNDGAAPLIFIELQAGDILDEADIERKEDVYKRS
jgi:mannose-6-phosphate isomerase-like protein (cupin superfamily)